MSLNLTEIIGLGTSIVLLAIIAVAIINGDKTAKIITASGAAFQGSIKAATNPGRA